MARLIPLLLAVLIAAAAADLPTRKYLNLAALKTMAVAAEMEAQKRNVQVTICIVDESGNLLFFQKADGTGLNTIQFAQRKARYAALYGRPSKVAADQLKNNSVIQEHYGQLLFKLGRYDDAIAAWTRALSGDGDSIDRADVDKKIKTAKQKIKK